MNILRELGDCVKDSGLTYDVMQERTGVTRATLCRLAQGRVPLISVDVAQRIAQGFGYELRLIRKRK